MAFWAQRARKVGKQAQERHSCSTCFSAQASNTRAGCCRKQLHKDAGDAGKMTCRSSLSTQLPYRIETWNQECCRNSFDQITVSDISIHASLVTSCNGPGKKAHASVQGENHGACASALLWGCLIPFLQHICLVRPTTAYMQCLCSSS